MLEGPRVRSLNKFAPNSASRLMWLGFTLIHGFSALSANEGCSRRKRSHGVSSDICVASNNWTAMPKNNEKLYWMREYSLSEQVVSSQSPLFFATRVLEPSGLMRMTLLALHHFS